METEAQKEEVTGVGEWQSKLAELLREYHVATVNAYLFAKKRRDVSADGLRIGVKAVEALRENSKLLITYFDEHYTRESYAKDLHEVLKR